MVDASLVLHCIIKVDRSRMKTQRYFLSAVTVVAVYTLAMSLGHALPVKKLYINTKGQSNTFNLAAEAANMEVDLIRVQRDDETGDQGQDNESSHDDDSLDNDDSQENDQSEESQDTDSDDESHSNEENQSNESSQADGANEDSDESQDNEDSQDSDNSQDIEESQESETNEESQESQESEDSQDSEGIEDTEENPTDQEDHGSEESQENENSQDEEESQESETNEESQESQESEDSQDSEGIEDTEESPTDQEDHGNEDSQENENSQDEEETPYSNEDSQINGNSQDNGDNDDSQGNEGSQVNENSQDNGDTQENEETRHNEENQDNEESRGDENSQGSEENQDSEDSQIESQDDETGTSIPKTTMHTENFERACRGDELLGLPLGNVGDKVNALCESGFFEGVWSCQHDSNSSNTEWIQMQCSAPEDLQFAATSMFRIDDPVKAVNSVLVHVYNATLNISVASTLTERVMVASLHHSRFISNSSSAMATLCRLLSTLDLVKTLPKSERAAVATRLLHALDLFALKCINSDSDYIIDCPSSRVAVIDIVPGSDVVALTVGKNSITLPNSELLHSIGLSSAKAVSYYFENLSDILVDTDGQSRSSVITPVISTSLFCGNSLCSTSSLMLSRPVKVVLEQQLPSKNTRNNNATANDQGRKLCSFWQLEHNYYYPSTGYWSQRGCVLNEEESTGRIAVCDCSHLTHFAVLLSPGVKLGTRHKIALQAIGYIGIIVSLTAMAITVLVYICLRSLWSMRTYVHVNLCLSLMAAQLLFVVAIDKTGNKIGCSIVAVILQYLFLASFMWMLMEGVVLYVLLVKVFVEGSHKKYIFRFTLVSYGLPALYMCITVPMGFFLNGQWHYGNDELCWLRYDTHFVWAFIVPVILIIMVNFGLFIMAVVIMYKHQHKRNGPGQVSTVKKWTKTSLSLTTVMGLTWISGVLFFNGSLIAFAYIFTIVVAFEGVAIFVLFVVMSKQVREALLVCVKNKVSDSDFLSEHVGSRLEKFTTVTTRMRRESAMLYFKNLHQQRRAESNQARSMHDTNAVLSQCPVHDDLANTNECTEAVACEELPPASAAAEVVEDIQHHSIYVKVNDNTEYDIEVSMNDASTTKENAQNQFDK